MVARLENNSIMRSIDAKAALMQIKELKKDY